MDQRDNDTSIFNDEFFIYRPDKKRSLGNEEETFNFSKNNSHIRSGLLTMQSREEDILNIVSNLNKPLNEVIIDKINKVTTKKMGKSSTQFSTTDKSKGEDMSNYANNLNNLMKKTNEKGEKGESLQAQEGVVINAVNNASKKENSKEYQDLNKKEKEKCSNAYNNPIKEKKVDNFQMVNSTNTNSKYNYISEKDKESLINNKKTIEFINVSNAPNNPKNKIIVSSKNPNIQNVQRIPPNSNTNTATNEHHNNKSPNPITMKNGKIPLGGGSSTNIKIASTNSSNNNKVIDFRLVKNENKPNYNSSRFANLLYTSDANVKNYSARNNSNSNVQSQGQGQSQGTTKTHHKNMKSMDYKFNIDLETPTYQKNTYSDAKYLEMISTTNNKNTEEKSTPSILNFNKVSRSRHNSNHNYDNLLFKQNQEKSVGKTNSKLSNKEVDVYLSDINKLKKLNSDQNFISNNQTKLNNYVSNPTKKANNMGISESSVRMLSSISIKAASSQVKVKFTANENIPSSSRANAGKVNSKTKGISNYYQSESKIANTTKNATSHSKPKEGGNIMSSEKTLKKTPQNRRMKSGDFFSNNYLTTNNTNPNAYLQKIISSKNIVMGGDKSRKQFSPKSSSIKKL